MRQSRPLTLAALSLATLFRAPALAGAEEPPRELTLREAFSRALSANAAIEAAKIEVRRAEDRIRYARSFVMPRVSLSGSTTYNSEEAAFGSGAERRILQPQLDWTARVGFTQPIYAGLREWRAFAQTKLLAQQAGLGQSATENDVLLGVGVDYLIALEAEDLLKVERQNLELAGHRRELAQAFFDVGEVTRVDVLRAEAAIQGSERRLAAAQGERDKALGRLRVALALDDAIAVRDPGDFLPPMPDEAKLFAQAVATSPELRQAELAVEIAGLEIQKQKGANLPVLSAEGGYQTQKRNFPTDSNAFLALNLRVPLFTAGEVFSLVEDAREQEALARLRLDDLKRRLREALHAALLDVQTARTVLDLARRELSTVEAEHAETLELWRAQEATSLDLETAELALAAARRTAATAATDLKNAELRTWHLAGALPSAFAPPSTALRGETPQ